MNKYKLNQKIFAASTCSSDNDLIDIELTTIKDVITHNGTNTRILLGEGHNWGACPDRTPEGVISCKKDIKPYFDREIESVLKRLKERRATDIVARLNERKCVLHVEFRNKNSIQVKFLDYKGKTESLREGVYKQYGYIKIKEGEVRPDLFRDLNSAFKYFEKTVLMALK